MGSIYLGSQKVAPVMTVSNGSTQYVLTPPDYSNGTVLTTGTLHDIDYTGWIMTNGSVRIGSNTGKQVASGGATVHIPIAAGTKVYVSGAAATFYPCM